MDDEDKIFVKDGVDIDKGRKVVARVKKYKGNYYFDLRIFSNNGNPTKKGLTVRHDLVSSVLNLFEDVYEEGCGEVERDMQESRSKNMKRDLKDLKRRYR